MRRDGPYGHRPGAAQHEPQRQFAPQGGNPTNDPRWKGAYIERTTDSYYSARRHCSVIAFSLAENSSNGTNLYDSYLTMKQLGDERPVIYPAAEGEWNTDLVVTE